MSVTIRPANAADSAGIVDLFRRTPQDGFLQLAFERDPDYFVGARVNCHEPEAWVAESAAGEGELAAVFNIGRREIFVNGRAASVRYAHDLRIAPEYRGGLLLHRMFRHLRRVLAPGEWMQTVILDGNDASISTVGSGRAGLPVYYPFGEIETSLIYTKGVKRVASPARGIEVRRAQASDISAMQAFAEVQGARRQFFVRTDFRSLANAGVHYAGLAPANYLLAWRHGELAGIAGDWDQSAFRRTRVRGYPGALRWLRHAHNAFATIGGGMHLPAAGECFRYRCLHGVLVRNDDRDVFQALLDQALVDNREASALVCGFFRDDPLASVAAGYRRRVLASRHYLVSWDGDPREQLDPSLRPWIDVARL